MFAGDVTFVDPVFRQVTHVLTGTAGTADDLMNAFKDACREELARRAEAKVLSVYNLSMADFLQNGQQYFNEADHSRLIHEIEDLRTRILCEFLVHGFDPTAYPHLFVADHCGAIQEFGRGGFWAIGSGQQNALSILFFKEST